MKRVYESDGFGGLTERLIPEGLKAGVHRAVNTKRVIWSGSHE